MCGRWGLCRPTDSKNGVPEPERPTPCRVKLASASTANVDGERRAVRVLEVRGVLHRVGAQAHRAVRVPALVRVVDAGARHDAELHTVRGVPFGRVGLGEVRQGPGLGIIALRVREVAHLPVVERGRVHQPVAAGIRPLVAAVWVKQFPAARGDIA
jgi:hypothetical protein